MIFCCGIRSSFKLILEKKAEVFFIIMSNVTKDYSRNEAQVHFDIALYYIGKTTL